MGRALFSQTYRPQPLVPQKPERVVSPCEKWSVWNNFDPDSDDFFDNAQEEVFIDPHTVRQQGAAAIADEVRRATIVDTSPDTSDMSDSGASDAGSPMATGPDDPAVLFQEPIPFITEDEWQRHFSEPVAVAGGEWRSRARPIPPQPRNTTIGYNPDNTTGRPDIMGHIVRSYRPRSASAAPPFFPPSNVRSSIIGGASHAEQIPTPPRSPALSRPVVALPPSPRSRSRSPRRVTATPTTPQSRAEPSLVSPSPSGSVTPARPYTWGESVHWHPIPAIPASPTRVRGTRDGPLTNPRARMSYARISTVQAPVLIQNVN